MKISELFYSIQGEGKRIGVPSFFIRTNNCNLRCMFASGNLCDTPYTSWSPEDSKNIGDMSTEDILNEYKIFSSGDVVITGGEPTIQDAELTELCKGLKKAGAFITIETNGTKQGDFLEFTDLLSVSPKLSSSTPFDTKFENMHSGNRIDLNVLKALNEYSKKMDKDIQWKFVYCSEKDLDEIIDLQTKIGIKSENIYLMPEGITDSEITNKRIELIEVCKKYSFNYSERLHILIWGNKRGV